MTGQLLGMCAAAESPYFIHTEIDTVRKAHTGVPCETAVLDGLNEALVHLI